MLSNALVGSRNMHIILACPALLIEELSGVTVGLARAGSETRDLMYCFSSLMFQWVHKVVLHQMLA